MSIENWLLEPNTPQGRAWIAVLNSDYGRLATEIAHHGAACTGPSALPGGWPVTPLTQAAKQGDSLAVRMLLDAGADPNHAASGNQIQSPTQWAIEAKSLGCARLLLAAGATAPKWEDWAQEAVLSTETEVVDEAPSILRAMLAAGAPATDAAMWAAISTGRHVAALDLIAHGGHVDAVYRSHPMMSAALQLPGSDDSDSTGPQMLRILLAATASPDIPCGPQGLHRPPALGYAIECGAAWAIRPLIRAGADTQAVVALIEKRDLLTWGAPHCGSPHDINAALLAFILESRLHQPLTLE